jgi:UDP-N-acetylglucosamine 2-epimerase (non-hydrolysing)
MDGAGASMVDNLPPSASMNSSKVATSRAHAPVTAPSPKTKAPVLVVAGARPNFMKIAPILAELEKRGRSSFLLHTGQHYSAQMSDAIFKDLDIRDPDQNLGIGSGTHAQQTARVMEAFEPVLMKARPAWVVVVGDVNSTLACSLVASKLKEEIGCKIAHVEAGLRANDWRMPEEVNRVLTDRLSDLLLTPSLDAKPNLLAEGIPEERIVFVGNVMIDTLFRALPKARELPLLNTLGVKSGKYAVATLHRPSNVDSPETLRPVLEGLAAVAERMPVVLPVHPRTKRNAETFGLTGMLDKLMSIEPLAYLDMLALNDGAAVVLTDSGGIQEETTALGVPCVTLREQTERPITVTEGTNRMAPWPLTKGGIMDSFQKAIAQGRLAPGAKCPEGWDGKAAVRIVDALG